MRAAPGLFLLVLGACAGLFGWLDEHPSPVALTLLGTIYGLVACAGLIGSDVADGTVQLVLARPLTRNQYLAGRGLGAAALAVAGGLFLLGCNVAGARLHGPFGGGERLPALALTQATELLWQVGVCFALSTFVPGRGDVVVFVVLRLSASGLALQAKAAAWPWLAAALYWWKDQLDNTLAIVGGLSPLLWHDLARWSSNLAAVLFLGAVIFHRKEFSYGSE
jgi:ABC-2 family transporter